MEHIGKQITWQHNLLLKRLCCRRTPAEKKEHKVIERIRIEHSSIMDQRQTFDSNHELFTFVTLVSNKKQRAFLLIDNKGLTRVEGVITLINKNNPIENTCIVIDNRDTVLLREIIGINGLFRSDYSEC